MSEVTMTLEDFLGESALLMPAQKKPKSTRKNSKQGVGTVNVHISDTKGDIVASFLGLDLQATIKTIKQILQSVLGDMNEYCLLADGKKADGDWTLGHLAQKRQCIDSAGFQYILLTAEVVSCVQITKPSVERTSTLDLPCGRRACLPSRARKLSEADIALTVHKFSQHRTDKLRTSGVMRHAALSE